MNAPPPPRFGLARALAFVVCAMPIVFADNLYGSWRFARLCDTQAGLKVYAPLERGVGWVVHGGSARAFAAMPYVGFVRAETSKGTKDIRYLSGPTWDDRSFAIESSTSEVAPRYDTRWRVEPLPREIRTSIRRFEIVDASSGEIAAEWRDPIFNQNAISILGTKFPKSCEGNINIPFDSSIQAALADDKVSR